VAGVVATRVARYHRKIIGKDVDDFALTLVAPLRTYHYCRVQPGQIAFPSIGTLSPLTIL